MNKAFRALLLTFASVFALALLMEGLGQFWVRRIARRGKLFTVDPVLGWRPKAGLHLTRRNADGEYWRVVTDAAGWRPVHLGQDSATHRLVVLGDSYAFGEGVDVESRFDALIARRHPDLRIVNRGVMGFGTDQQLLAAEPVLDSLGPGDVVLMLTYQNDMIDVQRRKFAGRAKPYFEPIGDSLLLHLPEITWRERLRDASYLAAVVFASRERQANEYTPAEWQRGIDLYGRLVRQAAARMARRGATMLVAHHGDSALAQFAKNPDPYAALAGIGHVRVLSLDSALGRCPDSSIFLRDGHWNAAGHRCVADHLDSVLATVIQEQQRDSTARRFRPR